MRKLLLLCLTLIAGLLTARAQSEEITFTDQDAAFLAEMEDTLGLLSWAVVNDSMEENRFGATREMIPRLVKALKVRNSFHYPFEQLQTVSIQYPADSSFRVFTWQLMVDPGTYRYFGAIQLNSADLQLFPLIDRSFDLQQDPAMAVLPPDQWFGALYYRVQQVDAPGGTYYLLYGFDGNNAFSRRKLVDVLTFAEGKPVFGAPVFVRPADGSGEEVINRLVVDYSSDASIVLNYDEEFDLIIHDHLAEVPHPYTEMPVNVPDGTFEGYQLQEDGRWHHVDNVFPDSVRQPIFPQPQFDSPKRNILGEGGRR